VNAKEFWLKLEYRVCSEIDGLRDGRKFRDLWCDGFDPEQLATVNGLPGMTGQVWMGRGASHQEVWQFVLVLPGHVRAEEDVDDWATMLPADDVTGWLWLDEAGRTMKVDPLAARPDRNPGSPIQIDDLAGGVRVDSEQALLDRLRTVRKGRYGAFILSHDERGPFLFVHINEDLAYVHFFDDLTGDNAGYQPTDMTPMGCPETVKFVQTDGSEGSGIEMPDSTICSVDVAYLAAQEFFYNPARPACITWVAL
jgi:hypothetical protein